MKKREIILTILFLCAILGITLINYNGNIKKEAKFDNWFIYYWWKNIYNICKMGCSIC